MTGSDAWSIVAPILGGHMANTNNAVNDLDLAYVVIFKALKEYDERREIGSEIHKRG